MQRFSKYNRIKPYFCSLIIFLTMQVDQNHVYLTNLDDIVQISMQPLVQINSTVPPTSYQMQICKFVNFTNLDFVDLYIFVNMYIFHICQKQSKLHRTVFSKCLESGIFLLQIKPDHINLVFLSGPNPGHQPQQCQLLVLYHSILSLHFIELYAPASFLTFF